MKYRALTSRLAAGILALLTTGCGAAAQPTASQAPASSAASGAQGSAAAKASAATSAKPAAWDQVVAAAKGEGQLVIRSQAGSSVEDALSGAFMKAYPDIKVEYSGAGGAESVTKLVTERQAGKFLVDVALHGTSTLFEMAGAGSFDPMDSYLLGPQTQETSKWLGGKYTYADNTGKFIIMLTAGASIPFIYNPTVASASDFKSWKDLLNPKWKGKLAMFDPQVPGNGTATAQLWYITPSLGKDFIKQLFQQQDVVFSKDDRQLSDWIGRSQYPIGIAAQGFEALKLKQQGVPMEFLPPDALQEGSFFTTSFGSVAVLNKAPHPNATKVYMNWLLSKEGQESLSKASGYPSRRLDASTTGLIQATIPKPTMQYPELNNETNVRARQEVLDYLKSVIK